MSWLGSARYELRTARCPRGTCWGDRFARALGLDRDPESPQLEDAQTQHTRNRSGNPSSVRRQDQAYLCSVLDPSLLTVAASKLETGEELSPLERAQLIGRQHGRTSGQSSPRHLRFTNATTSTNTRFQCCLCREPRIRTEPSGERGAICSLRHGRRLGGSWMSLKKPPEAARAIHGSNARVERATSRVTSATLGTENSDCSVQMVPACVTELLPRCWWRRSNAPGRSPLRATLNSPRATKLTNSSAASTRSTLSTPAEMSIVSLNRSTVPTG